MELGTKSLLHPDSSGEGNYLIVMGRILSVLVELEQCGAFLYIECRCCV